jgi:hypothetical protein
MDEKTLIKLLKRHLKIEVDTRKSISELDTTNIVVDVSIYYIIDSEEKILLTQGSSHWYEKNY